MKCETGAKPDVVQVMMKLSQMLNRAGNDQVVYEASALDMTRLHGMLCLGVDHQAFTDEEAPMSKEAVERFRDFCISLWISHGLSHVEADLVDGFMDVIVQEHKDRGDLLIEHDLMERFKAKYGRTKGLTLVVFYLNWKSGGEVKAKGELSLRSFYNYRKILYRDHFLSDDDIQSGGKVRWVE